MQSLDALAPWPDDKACNRENDKRVILIIEDTRVNAAAAEPQGFFLTSIYQIFENRS